MKEWIRRVLGIDYIRELISKNNAETKKELSITQKQLSDTQIQLDKITKQLVSLSTSDNALALIEEKGEVISEFTIGNELADISFKSIDVDQFKNNLPRIFLNKENQDAISGTLSNIAGGALSTGLLVYATKGLFKATANPGTLMKLSSGGVSSAVMEGGKIVKQAGFINPGMSMFTPMVIFQIMSVVTGQYYMDNIDKQLNTVQEKLNELINLFHIERQAKLIKSFQFLFEYLNKKNFVIEDFVLLKTITSELTDVREEYYLMIESSVSEIKKNNDYSSANSLKMARKKVQDFEDSDFIFKMKTSLIADELYHLAKLTEFHMNLCYKNPDLNRINIISDQLNELSNFKQENISFHKTQILYYEIKGEMLSCIYEAKTKSWFNKDEIIEINKNVEKRFHDFEAERNDKIISIATTYKNVVSPFKKEKTIIIDNRLGKHELYME